MRSSHRLGSFEDSVEHKLNRRLKKVKVFGVRFIFKYCFKTLMLAWFSAEYAIE